VHAVIHSPQQAFRQQSSGAAASRSRSHSSATNTSNIMNGDAALDVLDHALHQPASRWDGVSQPSRANFACCPSSEGDMCAHRRGQSAGTDWKSKEGESITPRSAVNLSAPLPRSSSSTMSITGTSFTDRRRALYWYFFR